MQEWAAHQPALTLLRAHDEAFTNHDLNGVMACFTEKAAIMGTGPAEIWSGPDEIKVAYEHFFEGFDKGEQKFEYQFRIGGVVGGDFPRKVCRAADDIEQDLVSSGEQLHLSGRDKP